MAAITCERCGAPLPAEARFCPRCGAPVALPTTQERKVLTVLFADLAGSTELAARLDPERFREVIGAFYRVVSAELESLRGRPEKFAGDAVMAVFGLPHAHEDDALRAVRAGFIIRDRTAKLGEMLGLPLPLQVRVGVNSGPVATGSGPTDQFLVSGVAVNLAVRLEQAAAPNEILAGDTTWQLTRHAVEFGPPRTITAKGFDLEITARPVLELSTRSARRTIPLVDRRRELGLLSDTFARAREAGRAHMMTILGEAGIGKSRLVDEFVAGLEEDVKVLVGRSSEFDEDPTFAPVSEMIRRELGVERTTPRPEIRERLHDVVEGCCDPTDVQRIVGRLGLALGLGTDPRESDPEVFWSENLARFEAFVDGDGREGSRFRAAELRAGLLDLLRGLARGGPLVMVFEDLQVAQPDLLDLIEGVLRGARRLPLLVICVARDHLLEFRPEWGGGIPDSVTIRLDPLSLEDATELAEVAGDPLSEGTARDIAAHAGGNPFFIIETTGMMTDEHPEHLIGAAHSHLLPPTVQAVVASRLDHLSEEAHDLARKASVFPRGKFHLSDLTMITDPRPESLKALEDAELIVRDGNREGVWRFRHDVLRDVAYDSLPKRERQRLHVLVAEALQKQDGERYPQSVAWHLEHAARAALDLDPMDRALAERARKALARAGDRARWRMESRTALDLYQRALSLSGPEHDWGEDEAKALSAIGEARYWLGDYREASAAFAKAMRVDGSSAWVRAHAGRFRGDIALNVDADPDRATVLFEEALAAARELGDGYTVPRTLLMAGWAPYWRGDLATARAMFEEALEAARQNPDRDAWAEARALTSLTSVISPVGDEEEVLPLVSEALELGRRASDSFTIAVAKEQMANSFRRMLRLDEAIQAIDEAVAAFRELGARWELASALGDRGYIHRLSGRMDLAESDLKEALQLSTDLGERSLFAWTAGKLVLTLLSRGKFDEARATLERAAPPASAEPGTRPSILEAQTALALAEGDLDRAASLAREVVEARRSAGWANEVAATVWWAASLLGPDAADGAEVEEARATLERNHWRHALREPEIDLQAVQLVRAPTG
jgi:class 3 adenylate cyclase/tetratricopeptide (TPR) repeat protein